MYKGNKNCRLFYEEKVLNHSNILTWKPLRHQIKNENRLCNGRHHLARLFGLQTCCSLSFLSLKSIIYNFLSDNPDPLDMRGQDYPTLVGLIAKSPLRLRRAIFLIFNYLLYRTSPCRVL